MANLLNMLKDQIGEDVFSQAGQFLGADSSGVKSAMGAALPSILGSMISKSTTPEGAKGMMDMITKGGHDGSIFGNLGSLLGGGDATSGLLNSGSGILKSLIGDKLGSVVDMISSVSGLKKGTSSSIMSMAAPLVMGMVGKWVKEKALDAIGLGKLLGSQSQHVASALPAGMGSLLGFSKDMGLGDQVEKAAAGTTATVETAVKGSSNILRRVLPIVLILGLGVLGWTYFKNTDAGKAAGEMVSNVGDTVGDAATAVTDKVGDAAGAVVDGTKDAVGAAGDLASNAVDAVTEAAKAALVGVEFAAGSVGEKFSTWLGSGAKSGDNSFQFNNLNFATGSANIEDMTEVNNLAKVLAAYKNVKIEVGGHTDSSGNADSNMTLSQQRADAVKAQLVAQGIEEARITTKGYGATMPATEDAADAANRRVEIKATEM